MTFPISLSCGAMVEKYLKEQWVLLDTFKKSEFIFRNIFENMEDLVFITDFSKKILFHNNKAYQLLTKYAHNSQISNKRVYLTQLFNEPYMTQMESIENQIDKPELIQVMLKNPDFSQDHSNNNNSILEEIKQQEIDQENSEKYYILSVNQIYWRGGFALMISLKDNSRQIKTQKLIQKLNEEILRYMNEYLVQIQSVYDQSQQKFKKKNLSKKEYQIEEKNLVDCCNIKTQFINLYEIFNEFYRLRTKQQKMFNVKECIIYTLDIISHQAIQNNYTINLKFDNSFPTTVSGDVEKFKQLLHNLLENIIAQDLHNQDSQNDIKITCNLNKFTENHGYLLEFIIDFPKTDYIYQILQSSFENLIEMPLNQLLYKEIKELSLFICQPLAYHLGGQINIEQTDSNNLKLKFEIPFDPQSNSNEQDKQSYQIYRDLHLLNYRQDINQQNIKWSKIGLQQPNDQAGIQDTQSSKNDTIYNSSNFKSANINSPTNKSLDPQQKQMFIPISTQNHINNIQDSDQHQNPKLVTQSNSANQQANGFLVNEGYKDLQINNNQTLTQSNNENLFQKLSEDQQIENQKSKSHPNEILALSQNMPITSKNAFEQKKNVKTSHLISNQPIKKLNNTCKFSTAQSKTIKEKLKNIYENQINKNNILNQNLLSNDQNNLQTVPSIYINKSKEEPSQQALDKAYKTDIQYQRMTRLSQYISQQKIDVSPVIGIPIKKSIFSQINQDKNKQSINNLQIYLKKPEETQKQIRQRRKEQMFDQSIKKLIKQYERETKIKFRSQHIPKKQKNYLMSETNDNTQILSDDEQNIIKRQTQIHQQKKKLARQESDILVLNKNKKQIKSRRNSLKQIDEHLNDLYQRNLQNLLLKSPEKFMSDDSEYSDTSQNSRKGAIQSQERIPYSPFVVNSLNSKQDLSLSKQINLVLQRQKSKLSISSQNVSSPKDSAKSMMPCLQYNHKLLFENTPWTELQYQEQILKNLPEELKHSMPEHIQELLKSNKKQWLYVPENTITYHFPESFTALGVDDTEFHLEILLKAAQNAQIILETANGGEQALDMVQLRQSQGIVYNLILMDIIMPDIDGYEASLAIRNFEQEKKMPACYIVGLTADYGDKVKQNALENGMNDCINKPLKVEQLKKLIQVAQDYCNQNFG